MENTQAATPQLSGGERQDKAEFEQEKARVEALQATQPRTLRAPVNPGELADWAQNGFVTLTRNTAPTETSTGGVEAVQAPLSWFIEWVIQQASHSGSGFTA